MYLVELRPGKEELYRTGDELAAAIRSGAVDMHSRIYHRATSKWISVTLHPQYKAIVAELPGMAPAPAAPVVLPPLERTSWTFFNDSADALAGANDPPSAESGDEHERAGRERDDGDPNWRRPLALGITGALLIGGLQLAAAGPRPPWAARRAPAALSSPLSATTSGAGDASSTVAFVSTGQRWPGRDDAVPTAAGYTPPAAPPVDRGAPVLPAAPLLRAKGLLKDVPATAVTTAPAPASVPASSAEPSVTAMLQRWTAAHDSVRTRLESGMRVARLNQLFAAGRLSPGGGVTETRLSLAGVANFVRVYRQQQVVIDLEFQDSFAAASKEHGWSPETTREWLAKPARQDSPALAALTTSLIAGIDSLLGVLDAQAGAYAFNRNTISFEDAGAAGAYASLRGRIVATLDSAKAAGGSARAGPMAYLLQAIGTTRLPLAS